MSRRRRSDNIAPAQFHENRIHIVRGIVSVPNACYINSVVQMLYSIPPIASQIGQYTGPDVRVSALRAIFSSMQHSPGTGPVTCPREISMLRISEQSVGHGRVWFRPDDATQQSANALISELFRIPDMAGLVLASCGSTITHNSQCMSCGTTHRARAAPECVIVAALDRPLDIALNAPVAAPREVWCEACSRRQNRPRRYDAPAYEFSGTHVLVMAQDSDAVRADVPYAPAIRVSGTVLELHGAIIHRGCRAASRSSGHYTYVYCPPHELSRGAFACECSDAHVQPHDWDSVAGMLQYAVLLVYRVR